MSRLSPRFDFKKIEFFSLLFVSQHRLFAQLTSGVDVETFRLALSHIFQRIGELINERQQIVLDFGVGTLVCDQRVCDFVFKTSVTTQGSMSLKLTQAEPSMRGTLRAKYPLPPPTASQVCSRFG